MREQPTSDDRARKIAALREFYSGVEKLDFEGKSISRIYLGSDLLWDRHREIQSQKVHREACRDKHWCYW